MHRIIGGEFAIDSKLLSNKTELVELQYSSGRSALFSILMHISKKSNKILLPSYLCDSITRTVIDAGWYYDFYQLDEFLHINIDSRLRLQEYDAILVINYFGAVNLLDDIAAIRKENTDIVIIEDDVQAYYELNNSTAEYSFTSLRKWFPCPDGAIIHTKDDLRVESIICGKNEWAKYKLAGNILKGQADFIEDSVLLPLLAKGEELLESGYLSSCSNASKQIFSNLNVGQFAAIRKQNAFLLHCELEELGILHLYTNGSVPLFVPIFINNRDKLRKRFFAEQIFTPKHWPKINDILNGDSLFYDCELSLICDHRYGLEDMRRQIGVIKRYLNRK